LKAQGIAEEVDLVVVIVPGNEEFVPEGSEWIILIELLGV